MPPSSRIIADIDRAIYAFGIVYRNKGHLVKGLANRSGHRNHIEGRNRAGWGGVCVKNLFEAEHGRYLHADVISVKEERTMDIICLHAEENEISSSEGENENNSSEEESEISSSEEENSSDEEDE